VLADRVKAPGLYIGFNTQKDATDRMRQYYETNKFAYSLPQSHFFTKEVSEVPHHNVFDLICLDGLQSHMMTDRRIKDVEVGAKIAMKNLIERLLQIGKRVIIRVALQDQFGTESILQSKKEIYETVRLLRNLPPVNFQSLFFYQSVALGSGTPAKKRRRYLETFPAEPFEYAGVTVDLTYLVFT
jgi:hypothetical protein